MRMLLVPDTAYAYISLLKCLFLTPKDPHPFIFQGLGTILP